MSYFDVYKNHIDRIGTTGRDREINLIKRDLVRLAPMSAAYKSVTVNGVTKKVIVKSGDSYNTKELVCMPSDHIGMGSVVTFATKRWIIKERDFDDEVYSKCQMYMCNAYIKWKDKNNVVHTYYGYADDATKYSEGTEGTVNLRVGEFQLKIIVGLDAHTALLKRDMRFIIDADGFVSTITSAGDTPYAFRISRRNVVTGTYDGEGYIEITLVEDSFIEGKDDAVNMIAAQPWELNPPGGGNISQNETGWL